MPAQKNDSTYAGPVPRWSLSARTADASQGLPTNAESVASAAGEEALPTGA